MARANVVIFAEAWTKINQACIVLPIGNMWVPQNLVSFPHFPTNRQTSTNREARICVCVTVCVCQRLLLTEESIMFSVDYEIESDVLLFVSGMM